MGPIKPASAEPVASDSDLTDLSSSKSASPDRMIEKSPTSSPALPAELERKEGSLPVAAAAEEPCQAEGDETVDSGHPPEQSMDSDKQDVVMADADQSTSTQRQIPPKGDTAVSSDAAEPATLDDADKTDKDAEADDLDPASQDPKVDHMPGSRVASEADAGADATAEAKSEPVDKAVANPEPEEEPFDQDDEVQVAVRKAARQTWLEWECVGLGGQLWRDPC